LFLARFADDAAARIGATVLLSCSGLASGLAAFVGSRGTSALKVSLAGSAVIAGGAITALTILSASGNLGTKGGLLFGAVPVTGAILTAVAGALQLRSARPASAGT
jgi:hypothetical protein